MPVIAASPTAEIKRHHDELLLSAQEISIDSCGHRIAGAGAQQQMRV